MISLDRAHKILFKNLPNPGAEEVFIEDAIGHILAERLKSTVSMPSFNKSAVDGYACNHKYLRHVPAQFRSIGSIEAGGSFDKKPEPGDCVKIMTGAAVPEGFDSVIMIEDTEPAGNKVIMKKKVNGGANIARKGEDLRKGEIVLKKGEEIYGAEVMVAASLGRRK